VHEVPQRWLPQKEEAIVKLKITTAIILASLPILLGLYDLVAYLVSGPKATFSTVILRWSEDHFGLTLLTMWASGFLQGHVFWPQRRKKR